MATQKARRQDIPVLNAIHRLAMAGHQPAAIFRELKSQQKNGPLKDCHIPHIRTVERIAEEVTPEDDSGPWNLETAVPGEIRTGLDALAAVIVLTEGRSPVVTKAEVQQMIRLREAAPGLPTTELLRLSRLYLARRGRGKPTDDLDALLAFAPWATASDEPGDWETYDNAVAAGWIVPAPGFITLSLKEPGFLYESDRDLAELEAKDQEAREFNEMRQKVRQMRARYQD